MKTQIKRISKSSLAVVLTLCLLFSCLTVGIVATDAAKMNSESTGFNINGKIYFKKPSGWTNVRMSIGGNNNNKWREMIAPAGNIDDIYYFNVNWSNADGFFFTDVSWSCVAEQGAYWDWFAQNTTNRTGYSNSATAGNLYISTGNADSNAPSSETYTNITVSAKAYVKNGSSFTEADSTIATASVTGKNKDNTTSSSSIAKYTKSTFTTTKVNNSYTFLGWYNSSNQAISGATNTKYTINSTESAQNLRAVYELSSVTYNNISIAAKGTTDGTNYNTLSGTPATISANSYTTGSSALNISAGTVTGYTFAQWKVTAGSGTIGSATTANTTFTPSASNTTVTAQYKKNYTFSNGTTDTHGTVTVPSGTVLAGASYSGTVTPAAGYKIKSLTVGGNTVTAAAGKTSAYTYSGTTGSSTTGTSTPISVVATFEAITDLKLYIAGRFRVRPSSSSSSWTTTYASGSDWNATSTNIPFTYLSGTTYKVDTYASLAELSAKPKNNQDPWFFVYDKTNSKAWHPTTQNRELGTTTEYNLTTNTDTYNVRFNSSSPDSPVTIYFDYSTKRLWYSVPDLYDVAFADATGGSVTASPSRAEAGTEITLTVTPANGYKLKSLTAKDSSNATVTITNNKFTMPAKNVTVTPVFEKITWSGLTAVGKYSTTAANDASYNNDFPAGSAPNVTIAATSATQVDGVKVTAPANNPDGYVFAGWYTAKGSFANPANKDTTFYPNAANAIAIAKYKKIFNITSSVDSNGTGAGTVKTSKTSVEAGGSYDITATAKPGSAIESVKVNGTAKTATASQTISSVSADQTVKVKFKSNVYLKGTMNATAWAGDVMKANSAGTTYTKSEVVLNAGTTYEFKHWVDSGGDGTYSTTVSSWALNNIATHSTKGDGYGGTNLTITPSVKAKVTFVSDGTKFTSITAIPYDSTQYNVTLTQSADYTITSTYMGVEYTTSGKNANVTVPVYSGTKFSYTVTPASGKYLSGVAQSESVALSPAFSATTHANSYEGTVSSVSKAFAVSATAANKLSVTAKTNKAARGTVSVNKSTAAPGESITITVSPKNGTLKSLTATYANGAEYTCNLSTKEWTKTKAAPTGAGASKKTGAAIKSASTGAAQTIDMEMKEDSAVTINATFEAYSGESTWYYNGYDTSGNAVSGYHGRQMTEGMVGGEKFSFYQVVGRTGTHQLMTVSNGAASSGTRYVYFTASAEGGWSTDENHQYAYFYNDSGKAGNDWPGYKMTKYTTNDYGQNVYRVEIPTSSSPTGVVFNNASNSPHKTTDVTDLTKGGYYLLTTHHNDNGTEVHDWQSYDCTYPSAGYTTGTEYFYGSDNDQSAIYSTDGNGKSIFNTTGFYRHGTNNKNYAKPRLTDSDKGDYYINVLYPNTTYTINGVTKKTGTNPMIIWSTEPLAGDDENVKIYAKDGSIRAETFGSTYANIADTKIYAADGTTTVGTKQNGSIENQTYETYKAAKGDTIVIKTQIGATDTGNLSNADALKAKYYVRGFCVNGEVSELLEWNANGLYTLTYKVPEDYEGKNIEITPIYYLKDTTANPIVTYRVTGFTDELKAIGSGKPGWGDTLYTYPFYGKLGGQNNAFGAYPGQPMVYYKGQYQMQIPQKSTAWDPYNESASTVSNTNVAGVTMSNGYWDSVHKQIMGYGDNSTSADHVQTYDYGDFYKIFNEKAPVDNIVFDFKYRTKKHNFENQPAASVTKSTLDTNYGTNGNGFELLTNFHGRNVDLFGTPLSGDAADPSKTTPVYVVSIGGVNETAHTGVENIAGYYATEWMVYGSSDGTNYSRISAGDKNSIPPEVLVLNDDDETSFNTTTYPSAVNTTAKPYKITDWKALYTALEAYRGKPVMISYEAADAQQGQEMYYTGTGGATRNDGRWLYSKNGENITSNIKIQYSDDNGVTYNDYNGSTPSGLSAYFTNDGVEGQMTYSTTIDPDKTFDFEAKTTNGSYKFVGWYMEDGTKITSDNASHTERSGSYTFVAKFMQVQSGQLILSHSADKGTISGTNYQGAGTAKIKVVVKDGDEVVRTYDMSTSDVTLDDKIIKSDSTYTIEVTLEATATGNDDLGTTVLANPSGQDSTYFSEKSSSIDGKTKTIVLNSFTVASLFDGTTQNVKNIIYHSYFTEVKFFYDILFQYTDRFGATKKLYKQGYLTAAQAANTNYVSVRDVGSERNVRHLMPAFLQTIAPHVSNFGETIKWNFVEEGYTFGVQDYVYNCTNVVLSTQTPNNKRNVTFVLPYQHTNGIATLDGNGVGTAATATNFKLIGENAVTYNTVPVLLNNGVNGIYSSDDKKNWIAAPAVINDNDTGEQKFFQYWKIAATTNPEVEVARCYFNGFNYVAYDNYIITAVYDTEKTSNADSRIYTGATYLETSRNQWNTKANSEKSAKDASGNRIAADLLYNDFVLNYNYKGVDIYKGASDSDKVKELGIVVERIDELDIKQDGTKDTDVSKYVNKYKTGLEANESIIKAVINGSNTEKKFTKHAIDKTSLDNKNRIEVYDAIYNGAGWNLDKQASDAKYTYKNYVYRVYSYMKYTDDNDQEQIALAEVPAYFTMYDEAVAGYTAPTSTNP